MTRHKAFKMKFYKFLLIVLIVLTVPSCKDDPEIGTISFTSSADCDIRLFDSRGEQVARVHYELAKTSAVVTMKRSGVYIVQAVNGDTTYKEPIAYPGGNLEYHITF